MNQKLFLLLTCILYNLQSQAQLLDTIVFLNKSEIVCNLKEVTPNEVRYTNPNEDLIYAIYKTNINVLKLKSGRTEEINSLKNFHEIKGGWSYKNIKVVGLESELIGLKKIENIFSFSGFYDFDKETFVDHQKLLAAMNGGTVVYITESNSKNFDGLQSVKNITSNIFSNFDIDTSTFMKKIQVPSLLKNTSTCTLHPKLSILKSDEDEEDFIIEKMKIVNGDIILRSKPKKKYELKEFKLIYCNQEYFIVARKTLNGEIINKKVMW